MTADDPEDLIVRALEPGERIVWSDRPHGVLRSARRVVRARPALAAAAVATSAILGTLLLPVGSTGALAGLAVSSSSSTLSIFLRLLTTFALLPFTGFVVGTLALAILHAVEERYAATDRGRGLLVAGGRIGSFALPPPDGISTPARGGDEHGTLELGSPVVQWWGRSGPRKQHPVAFHDVSYPLIALESVRAAARPAGPPA